MKSAQSNKVFFLSSKGKLIMHNNNILFLYKINVINKGFGSLIYRMFTINTKSINLLLFAYFLTQHFLKKLLLMY